MMVETCRSRNSRYQNRDLPMAGRLQALKLYRNHLVSQYADRCSFWSLKDVAEDQLSRILVVATDGADQDTFLNQCFPFLWSDLYVWRGLYVCMGLIGFVMLKLRLNIVYPDHQLYKQLIEHKNSSDLGWSFTLLGVLHTVWGCACSMRPPTMGAAWLSRFWRWQ